MIFRFFSISQPAPIALQGNSVGSGVDCVHLTPVGDNRVP
jgi:hypothetical protein